MTGRGPAARGGNDRARTGTPGAGMSGRGPAARDRGPMAHELLHALDGLDGLDLPSPRRIDLDADRESVERGLVQLVLTVVELLRQLMERQALRRVDQGGLSDDQVERLGSTLLLLSERMDQLKEHFGLRDEDLNLDLGPLGTLLEPPN